MADLPQSIYSQYLPAETLRNATGNTSSINENTSNNLSASISTPQHNMLSLDPNLAGVLAALISQDQSNNTTKSNETVSSAQNHAVAEALNRLVHVQEEMIVRMSTIERAVVGVVQRIESMEVSLNNIGSSLSSSQSTFKMTQSPPSAQKRFRESQNFSSHESSHPQDKRRRADDKRTHTPPTFAGDPCYNCGECDHLSRECPEERQSCANCGKLGHLVHFCFQPIRNTLKSKPKSFLPAKQSNSSSNSPSIIDSLFKQHVSKPDQPLNSAAGTSFAGPIKKETTGMVEDGEVY